MLNTRNEETDELLKNTLFDLAVVFYLNYIKDRSDIFYDNEEKDWDFVHQETEIYAEEAHKLLRDSESTCTMENYDFFTMLYSSLKLSNLNFSNADVHEVARMAQQMLVTEQDEIYKWAVQEYRLELEEIFDKHNLELMQEQVTEAKGERIA